MTLVFLVIFVASIWLAQYSLSTFEVKSTHQSDRPDAYMRDVTFVHYDHQGLQESTFYSPSMLHYPKKDTAVLQKPKLIARGENALIWVITANTGIAQNHARVIYLKGDVRIERKNTATQKITVLTTTALVAYPKEKYMVTQEPVVVTQPGSVIRGTGFAANLASGEIRLLSQTESVYEPPKIH